MTPESFNHEFYIGYGIYSFREVKDASFYSSVNTSGVYVGGYRFRFNQFYSVGIVVGYEKIQPVLKGRADIDSFYIKTSLLLVKLQRIIASKKKFDLYISGSVGFKQVKKHLINEQTEELQYGYEFVLAGLQYSFTKRSKLYIEAAYGDFCLLKGGMSFCF